MISLPPAIQRWITMLETTHLPQGRTEFKQKIDGVDHYCALGILCLANGHPIQDPHNNYAYVKSILGDKGEVGEVWSRNDLERLSFPAIAKWAEVYFSEHGPHIERKTSNAQT